MFLKFFKKNIIEIIRNPKIISKKIFVFIKLIFKLVILIFEIPIYIFCLPIIFFILILNNFYKIRFGIIRSQPFGNSLNDMSLIKLSRNLEEKKFIDIFCYKKKFCNKQLFKFAKREFKISYFYKYFYNLVNLLQLENLKFPNMKIIRDKYSFFKDEKKRFGKHFPYFKFNKHENEKGNNFLKKIGLMQKSKYVCLIMRDSKYKKTLNDGIDYNYHSFRNVNSENYKDAVLKLISKGYWVFRMGSEAEKKMNINSNQFIDYPFCDQKSDFLDVWLMANCDFCITSGTGLDMASICFGKPIVYTNLIEYKPPFFFFNSDLVIFKKIKCSINKEILSLSKILKRNLANVMKTETFHSQNLIIEENSDREITETVLEMEERINNKKSSHNTFLQSKFWEILHESNSIKKTQNHFKARVGKHFLNQNFHWLTN